MTRQEIMVTKYGEMLDMISCRAIDLGLCRQKIKLSYDEVMALN